MRFELSSGPDAPGEARHAAGEGLPASLPAARRSDAMLALSEIVANAVRHGRLGCADHIEVEILSLAGGLRISVVQPTSAVAAIPSPDDPPDAGGMGLAIVDAVTDRWGSETGPPGRVWFEMDHPV